MPTDRDIKYINREFGDFRTALVDYARNYFPETYADFSEASPGMMFIEMASYVGDVLSFYQDVQLQETFVQHAKNPENLYTLAYMLGYRPRVTNVAEVQLEVSQRVLATGSLYTPNWLQATRIPANSVVSADVANQPQFITEQTVDFAFSSSADITDVRVNSLDGGNPADYTLTKTVNAYSGEIKSITFDFTEPEKYATVTIDDTNIVRVLDIEDSDGNTWTEVPFLGQDTVFVEEQNTDTDSANVQQVLRLQRVPRRFVTRFTSKGVLQIQFGAGVVGADDSTFLPDPTNLDISKAHSLSDVDTAYDPSNFLFSRTYGLAPSNTTLTVRYVTGYGVGGNAPSNTINIKTSVTPVATDASMVDSVAFTNPEAAAGGKDGDSVVEIRQNALRSFSEQQRIVTQQDFLVRTLSLPSRFGTIAKAFVTRPQAGSSDSVLGSNPLALSLYVLAYDINGKLQVAPPRLKTNLQTYLSEYMMMTDSVNIRDASIINIGIDYEIVLRPGFAANDVLTRCNERLKEYFDIRNLAINDTINLSAVASALDVIEGVQTVKNIRLVNKAGGNYSATGYDVQAATRDNVVYPSYDPCCFEVKFPDRDIRGRVTSY